MPSPRRPYILAYNKLFFGFTRGGLDPFSAVIINSSAWKSTLDMNHVTGGHTQGTFLLHPFCRKRFLGFVERARVGHQMRGVAPGEGRWGSRGIVI